MAVCIRITLPGTEAFFVVRLHLLIRIEIAGIMNQKSQNDE